MGPRILRAKRTRWEIQLPARFPRPTRPAATLSAVEVHASLPGLANGHLSSLFEPAIVSDPTDGQIVQLHGLNLYRAYAYQQLTRTLPDTDPRGPVLRDAARRHAEASLPAVCGGDYVAEHWLACSAVLLLT